MISLIEVVTITSVLLKLGLSKESCDKIFENPLVLENVCKCEMNMSEDTWNELLGLASSWMDRGSLEIFSFTL